MTIEFDEYPGYEQQHAIFSKGKGTVYPSKIFEFWVDSFTRDTWGKVFRFKFDANNTVRITFRNEDPTLPTPFIIQLEWPYNVVCVLYQVLVEPRNVVNPTYETRHMTTTMLTKMRDAIVRLGKLTKADALRTNYLRAIGTRNEFVLAETVNKALADAVLARANAKAKARGVTSRKVEQELKPAKPKSKAKSKAKSSKKGDG